MTVDLGGPHHTRRDTHRLLVGTTGASSGCHQQFETRVDEERADVAIFVSTKGIVLG